MKLEKLIAKKVKHHFSAKEKQVLFNVNSLEEHYDGLLIHKSDIIYLEEGELVNGYVRAGDVNMDNAVPKEVLENEDVSDKKVIGAEIVKKPNGMTYEEAEILMSEGRCVALPEWVGFLFWNIKTKEVLMLTQDGAIINAPSTEFIVVDAWKEVSPTVDQEVLLNEYFAGLEPKEETVLKKLPKDDDETVFEGKAETVFEEYVKDIPAEEVVAETAEVAAEPSK